MTEKLWHPFTDQCLHCGGDAEVFTSTDEDNNAYDGDAARCSACGCPGTVDVYDMDEADSEKGLARIRWHDEPDCDCSWCMATENGEREIAVIRDRHKSLSERHWTCNKCGGQWFCDRADVPKDRGNSTPVHGCPYCQRDANSAWGFGLREAINMAWHELRHGEGATGAEEILRSALSVAPAQGAGHGRPDEEHDAAGH